MTSGPSTPLESTQPELRDSLRVYFEWKPAIRQIALRGGYEGTFVTEPGSSFPETELRMGLTFALGAAGHELINSPAGWFVIIQDGLHLLGNRHFNAPCPG